MGRALRIAAWALLALVLLYLALVSLLYFNQRLLLFPVPTGAGIHPAPDPGYREVSFASADGTPIRAFYHPAAPGRATILFYHGNADRLTGSERTLAPFVAAGMGALLPEYRGYGGDPGQPSERGFYADGRAARAWLARAGVAPERQVIFGYSLGTGVASELAAEARPAALVLVAPFTSIPHVAGEHYPFVPTGWLVVDRFDTLAKLPRVRAPILIVHGTADRTVPFDNGASLARARPDATFWIVPGATHGVVWDETVRARIRRWIEQHARL
jgi:uncharacterized protein